MFKRNKESTRTYISPEIFSPVLYSPTQRAVSQIGSLADFLLRVVDNMSYKLSTESDGKVVEISVSVRKEKNHDI